MRTHTHTKHTLTHAHTHAHTQTRAHTRTHASTRTLGGLAKQLDHLREVIVRFGEVIATARLKHQVARQELKTRRQMSV